MLVVVTAVDIRVLGPLEIDSGGPLPLGTPKQRTVLALLLARDMQRVDQFTRPLEQRRSGTHLIESGGVRASKPGGVRVVREAEQRDVREVVGDVDRIDPRDVGDDEIRRIDTLRRHETVTGEEPLQLAAKEEVDPHEQDRRHADLRR